MNSAYDAQRRTCTTKNWNSNRSLIKTRTKIAEVFPAELVRYKERSVVKWVFGRLKDDMAATTYMCRHPKVTCYLMFGALTLGPMMCILP